MKYLFDHWETLQSRLEGAHLLVFLDFDGTLAPIAATPGEAVLPAETRSALERLAASPRCSIAVVSGRSLEDIMGKVGIEGIVYVGNHGLEATGAPSLPAYEPPRSVRSMLHLLRGELATRLKDFPGILFEDKRASLAVHYRLAAPDAEAGVEKIVHATVAGIDVAGMLEIAKGKKVLELRQRLGWNKGSAVAWLAHGEEQRRERGVVSVYIGDDVTDEDGFRALAGKGLTVLVGEPRASSAAYYVKNTKEVTRLLRSLAECCEEAVG